MWSFLDSPGRSAIPHRSASPIPTGDTDACPRDVEPRGVSKFLEQPWQCNSESALTESVARKCVWIDLAVSRISSTMSFVVRRGLRDDADPFTVESHESAKDS